MDIAYYARERYYHRIESICSDVSHGSFWCIRDANTYRIFIIFAPFESHWKGLKINQNLPIIFLPIYIKFRYSSSRKYLLFIDFCYIFSYRKSTVINFDSFHSGVRSWKMEKIQKCYSGNASGWQCKVGSRWDSYRVIIFILK